MIAGNKYSDILEHQLKFQEFTNARSKELMSNRKKVIERYKIAILDEIAETNEEANFKWWKNYEELNFESLKSEIADIFIITVDLFIRLADTPNQKYMLENIVDKYLVMTESEDEVGDYEDTEEYKSNIFKKTLEIAKLIIDIPVVDTIPTTELTGLFENFFGAWLELVIVSKNATKIVPELRRKQQENIQRQLGNVKGREDYKLEV